MLSLKILELFGEKLKIAGIRPDESAILKLLNGFTARRELVGWQVKIKLQDGNSFTAILGQSDDKVGPRVEIWFSHNIFGREYNEVLQGMVTDEVWPSTLINQAHFKPESLYKFILADIKEINLLEIVINQRDRFTLGTGDQPVMTVLDADKFTSLLGVFSHIEGSGTTVFDIPHVYLIDKDNPGWIIEVPQKIWTGVAQHADPLSHLEQSRIRKIQVDPRQSFAMGEIHIPLTGNGQRVAFTYLTQI